MTKPTAAELAAIRAVLFEPHRQQRMADDASSISVLLDLDHHSSERVVEWWVPDTGRLTAGAVEAAARCRSLATSYQQMSQEIETVEVNASDKRSVREVLGYLSGWWLARADAWGDEKPSSDPSTLAQAINAHFVHAYKAGRPVAHYFRSGT